MEKLADIELSLNKIINIPDMMTLTALETLNVSYNKVNSSGSFPESLKILALNNNSLEVTIEAFLKTISKKESIEVINISGNKLYGSLENEDILSDGFKIKEFRAAYNGISNSLDSSRIKTSWTSLDLSFNNISGVFPSVLNGVKNISLRCNKFDCSRFETFEVSKSSSIIYIIRYCTCSCQ